jgi:hypothetical protein
VGVEECRHELGLTGSLDGYRVREVSGGPASLVSLGFALWLCGDGGLPRKEGGTVWPSFDYQCPWVAGYGKWWSQGGASMVLGRKSQVSSMEGDECVEERLSTNSVALGTMAPESPLQLPRSTPSSTLVAHKESGGGLAHLLVPTRLCPNPSTIPRKIFRLAPSTTS